MMKTRLILPLIILLSLLIELYAQKPELMLPVGHIGIVFNATFSPDGKIIVTSGDNTAKIWDVQSGKLLHSLDGHRFRVWNSTFSPDGKKIVTASDYTAKIWDVQSGKLLLSLMGHRSYVMNATFSPDGKNIVTAALDGARIWDSQSGNLLHNLEGHTDKVNNATFSPDGKIIVTASYDSTARIWDTQSGKLLRSLKGHKDLVRNATFSPDGKNIVTASDDGTARIWDTQSGKLLHSLEGGNATFSPDGKNIVTAALDGARIWDTQSGKLLHSLEGHTDKVNNATFSPDGKNIVTASSDSTVRIWDTQSGKLLHSLKGHKDFVRRATFSPDGQNIITAGGDSTAKIWDVQSGKLLYSLEAHTSRVSSATFSPDGKNIVTAAWDGTVRIWETQSGKLMHSLKGHKDYVLNATFSPDGQNIVTTSFDSTARIWDTQSGKLLHSFVGRQEGIFRCGTFSQDGLSIVTTSADNSARIWDTRSGKLLHSFEGHTTGFTNGTFSPDGKSIATVTKDSTARIWDTQSGKLLHSLGGHKGLVRNTTFSPDGKNIVTASDDSTVRIWDTQSGKLLHRFEGHTSSIKNATFSPDGKIIFAAPDDENMTAWDIQGGKILYTLRGVDGFYSPDGKRLLTTSQDQTTKIWDAETGKLKSEFSFEIFDFDWRRKKIIGLLNSSSISLFDLESGNELLSWVSVDNNDWVVKHSSGLFDASPEAMNKLYFVSNLDVIELNQLKARYFEPSLWKKVIGGERLRNVVGFNSVELPPDIHVGQVDQKGNLPLEVINRGGGIGEVTLYINGKEVVKDLRAAGVDKNSPRLSFSIPVSDNKNLVPGEENHIAVKAWNAGHWIETRGTVVKYIAPSKAEIKPAVHIVVCGVSDYTGEEIDLKFAAKDAEVIGRSLELGARRLFGMNNSYVYTLTTSQRQEHFPTKANIIKTFEKISTTASSADVIVVYFSGHGINLGGVDDDFYYLTQDAYTATASTYNDPAIRQQATLSSQELVELFKKVPALKQVLIIDACASGKVVDNLMAKRDIESGTLRALDRMKDRTGMHIITGCTADAVSYEASRYGQGVLTYSLLEGLRGLALREDKFVDVNKLFQFAQERVPVLASGIGGIQSPQVFSPNGSQSFDVGELNAVEKMQIPLANARPVYVRSNFIDEQKLRDILTLGKRTDGMLNEISARGETSQILFVDVSEYPEGCQLSGLYKQTKGKITLKLNKVCAGKESNYSLEAKHEDELAGKIIMIINK